MMRRQGRRRRDKGLEGPKDDVGEVEGRLYACVHTGRAVMDVIWKGLRVILLVLSMHLCITHMAYLHAERGGRACVLYRRFIIVHPLLLLLPPLFP